MNTFLICLRSSPESSSFPHTVCPGQVFLDFSSILCVLAALRCIFGCSNCCSSVLWWVNLILPDLSYLHYQSKVKSRHHYLYGAFYHADCVQAALQYIKQENSVSKLSEIVEIFYCFWKKSPMVSKAIFIWTKRQLKLYYCEILLQFKITVLYLNIF